MVLPSVWGKQARRQGTCDKADEHEGRGHTTNPKSAKGRDLRQICRPFIKPYEHEGRGHTTNPTSTKGGIRQTLRARRKRAYDKPVDLSTNPTSTKGGDKRQTSKINPYISQCFGILCKQKKRDIRQSRRARREGTYDKPLKVKPQFLNSWHSLQADKEGHTTKPTSTKGGDI